MGCCCNHHDDKCEEKTNSLEIFFTTLGTILFITGILVNNSLISVIAYILSYLLIGYEIFFNAIKKVFKKDMFDENFLMTIATLGALITKNYIEGIAVLLLYKIGEFLQDKAVENSKRKIEKAIDIKAEYANLCIDENVVQVEPSKVKIGDILLVKTGEKIPLDGTVIYGNSIIDMSALTGESIPKEININDNILSGSINIGGAIKIKVTKNYESSTVYKIIELIENASNRKSETEKYISKFAKIYTPIVTLLALLICILFPLVFDITVKESIFRALTFLVVSCPCALVISVPLAFFMGIGSSSKRGVLVKGSNYLDILASVDTILFDKTGTLTYGKFSIEKVKCYSSIITEEKMMEYICLCEDLSNHYIAKSIVSNYNSKIDKTKVTNHNEIPGKGIIANIENNTVIVGNEKLIQDNNIVMEEINEIGTIIHIAVNNEYIGYIVMNDTVKEESYDIVDKLKKLGIKETILLTGDRKEVAEDVSKKLNFDNVYSNLLPKDKARIVEEIKSDRKIAYVGDGINDGPVIAMADVGVAMGAGSDIAIETADMVLMDNNLEKLVSGIKVAKKTKFIVRQNITVILAVKIIFLILSALGISTMWEAVFADVGISLLSIFNCIRIYKIK